MVYLSDESDVPLILLLKGYLYYKSIILIQSEVRYFPFIYLSSMFLTLCSNYCYISLGSPRELKFYRPMNRRRHYNSLIEMRGAPQFDGGGSGNTATEKETDRNDQG